MSKADGIRDVVYIHNHLAERYFTAYGIEFKEFVHSLPRPLTNVLLLKHQFEDSDYHFPTHLDYVEDEQIWSLVEDNVYQYGDFCWIDFDDLSSLDLLEPAELAALLYLGHYKKPLVTPFSNKLSNQFVYLAHDDGSSNKTYYRDVYDVKHLISRLIPLKITLLKQKRFALRRKKVEYPPVPLVLANTLLTLMSDGLIIDFEAMIQTRKDIQIPIYTIGKEMIDMDELYNDRHEYKKKSKLQASLVLNKKDLEWTLVEA
ncbi:peptide ABC transporter permease [Bacillus sp. CGMCC 1.16541]|uniref:peptide ABC transporter permease n=1 Tax=Bacillus sp. CGMCC 1.16541 TaxID=2185143 RepID=UPI000D73483E|nr:peptide ABC transporter permease [Bacillus sp. CGMCC 1.16541]